LALFHGNAWASLTRSSLWPLA